MRFRVFLLVVSKCPYKVDTCLRGTEEVLGLVTLLRYPQAVRHAVAVLLRACICHAEVKIYRELTGEAKLIAYRYTRAPQRTLIAGIF